MIQTDIFEFSLNFVETMNKNSNINLNINTSIKNNTKFEDKNIEEKFIESFMEKNKLSKIVSDVIIVIGYLVSFIYILFGFYKLEILLVFVFFFICTLISLFFSYYSKNRTVIWFCDNFNIISLSLSLIIKAIIMCTIFYSEDNDNHGELLRIIIYQNLASNIYLFLKFDANIYVYSFYYFLNIGVIILCHFYSNKNNYYFMEAITSFFVSYIFYAIRKLFDYLSRSIFSEKLCFENLFNYTFEFINGLNCYKIYLNNDEIVIADNKLNTSINEFQSRTYENINMNSSRKIKEEKFFVPKNFLENLILYNNNLISEENRNQKILKVEADFDEILKNASQDELNLKDYLRKIRMEEKEICYKVNLKKKNFKKLGIYYFDKNDLKTNKFFEIYFRTVLIDDKGNHFYDLLFYDVSEMILSKLTINEEELIKQKVLAKIAHEFKTPINSIIGLISNIKEFIEKKKIKLADDNQQETKDIENSLNIVQNLSEYVIILVKDIIQFSNINKITKYMPNLMKLNTHELSIFCFEILKCLLKCNSSKSESITPVYSFDEILNEKCLVSDEIKIKQVLLNFISNSVKFTKFGKIELSFKFDENTKSLIINVEDTGIGIKEEDKEKLFKDFSMLEDGRQQNAQGSGLGLSICKFIASSIDIKLHFNSVYGKGSCFSIILPLKNIYENDSFIEIVENNMMDISSNYELDERKNNSCDIKVTRENIKVSNNHWSDTINREISIIENKKKSGNALQQIEESCSSMGKNKSFKESLFNQSEKVKDFCYNISNENLDNQKLKPNKKILIVDDNKFLNDSVKNILEKVLKNSTQKFDLIQLCDGVDIIKHVVEDQKNGNLISCILTDENMEYVNGSEAVIFLKGLEKNSKIMGVKIITITSNESSEKVNFLKKIGIAKVLEKPLTKSILLSALQEINVL